MASCSFKASDSRFQNNPPPLHLTQTPTALRTCNPCQHQHQHHKWTTSPPPLSTPAIGRTHHFRRHSTGDRASPSHLYNNTDAQPHAQSTTTTAAARAAAAAAAAGHATVAGVLAARRSTSSGNPPAETAAGAPASAPPRPESPLPPSSLRAHPVLEGWWE